MNINKLENNEYIHLNIISLSIISVVILSLMEIKLCTFINQGRLVTSM